MSNKSQDKRFLVHSPFSSKSGNNFMSNSNEKAYEPRSLGFQLALDNIKPTNAGIAIEFKKQNWKHKKKIAEEFRELPSIQA